MPGRYGTETGGCADEFGAPAGSRMVSTTNLEETQ
jgi:hypothetical protein